MDTYVLMKTASRARFSFAEGFPITVFFAFLRVLRSMVMEVDVCVANVGISV